MLLETLRWLHVIGATVLLGTGAGIAFFMVMAHSTKDASFIAKTARVVIIADWVFTASAVLVQPVTGLALAYLIGWPVFSGWVMLSIFLYICVGLFWLPVVFIQHRLRDLAAEAAANGGELSVRYFTLYRLWFIMGCPAFVMVLTILWLMVNKPAI